MGSCQGSTRAVATKDDLMRQRTMGGTVLSGRAVRQQTADCTLLAGCKVPLKGYGEHSTESRIRKFGLPTAGVCPPGQCQFTDDWSAATLSQRYNNQHDTMILTFLLPDQKRPLGLSTCACILAKCVPHGRSDPVVRPYTPISTNAMVGKFQILVKIYDGGIMTQHLHGLSVGATMYFRHSAANVKIQHPFGREHVTMLVGGSGITPMIQALHAILATPDDVTKVSLIYSNKTRSDIICEGLLDTWAEVYSDRFRVVHWVSRGDDYSLVQGRISRETIEDHSAPPSEDVLVMVCGPSSMYDFLCGPRENPELTGLLLDMGYTAEQVVKF